MVKFHGLKIKKITVQEAVRRARKASAATIAMHRQMARGTWVTVDEVEEVGAASSNHDLRN